MAPYCLFGVIQPTLFTPWMCDWAPAHIWVHFGMKTLCITCFQIELRSWSFQRHGLHRISSLEPIYVYFWYFILSLGKTSLPFLLLRRMLFCWETVEMFCRLQNIPRLSIGITECSLSGAYSLILKLCICILVPFKVPQMLKLHSSSLKVRRRQNNNFWLCYSFFSLLFGVLSEKSHTKICEQDLDQGNYYVDKPQPQCSKHTVLSVCLALRCNTISEIHQPSANKTSVAGYTEPVWVSIRSKTVSLNWCWLETYTRVKLQHWHLLKQCYKGGWRIFIIFLCRLF